MEERRFEGKRVPILRSKREAPRSVKYVPFRKEATLLLPDGVYLYYPKEERYIALFERTSPYNDREYVFYGTLSSGEMNILKVKDGKRLCLPFLGPWNYGYTLEGDAKALFHVSDALLDYNEQEGRSFAYVSSSSKLFFQGKEGRYLLSVRLFGDDGAEGERWAVLYLRKEA